MNPINRIGAMMEVDNALKKQILFELDNVRKLSLLRQQQKLLKNILNLQESEKAVN